MKKFNSYFLVAAAIIIAILVYLIMSTHEEPVRIRIPDITFEQEIDDGEPTVSLIVKAPETCKVGEMVTIDATGSNADVFEWLVIPTTKNFRVITNGQEALFSAEEPGTFIFIIAATRDGILQPLYRLQVVVEPGSTPVPVHDDFTIKVKSWLPPNVDPKILEKLARSFERVASAGHKDVAVLVKTTSLSNRAILGDQMLKYKVFLVAFSAYLKANLTDATIEEHVELWFSLAATLRSMK